MRQFLHLRPSMRRWRAFIAALLFLLPFTAHAQNIGARTKAVKLKRGQTLSLSLLTPLDSVHANVGDEVRAKLDRALIAERSVILPLDWIVHGTVTKVKRAGRSCHDGEIQWKLLFVTTPNGDQIRVQQIYSYPFDPNHSGDTDPEWVALATPLKKVGRAPVVVGEVAGAVALSPFLIPMAIAATEPCRGKAGHDAVLQPGSGYLFAVSKDTRVLPLP